MTAAPPAVARRRTHLRCITCEAFVRDDGLLEIEGLLVDTRPAPLRLPTGREVAADEPIHQMRMRLTVHRDTTIVDACAISERHPYRECAEAQAAYRRLIGLRIAPGFTREVKRLFRGDACTHLTELVPAMASTLFQVLWADSSFGPVEAAGPGAPASPLGGCHALRLDGEVVRTHFPGHRPGYRTEPAA